MYGNSSQGLRAVRGFLAAVSLCAQGTVAVPTATADHARADLPITAEELMPLKPSRSVYLVTEGPQKGEQVPFTFEQRGDQWILTKEEMARHELHRDRQGNLLVDRETDFREGRQIEYNPPIMLLPSTVDSRTSVTGTTRVIVRNTRGSSVKYRGSCHWQLDFIGLGSIDMPGGTLPVYRLRTTREIRLSLAQISMTIDFEYVRGIGMVATGIDQVIRALGLFTNREIWRLEQLP